MKITKWSLFDLLQLYPLIEITLAFKSNGSLGRSMGAPRPENDFQQFKQF
jgi:hypothetical protein